jgi:hypothetical protein
MIFTEFSKRSQPAVDSAALCSAPETGMTEKTVLRSGGRLAARFACQAL